MSSSRPLRTVITVVMDVLIFVAVFLCAALVVRFFGATASTEWGALIITWAKAITLPIGIAPIGNGYGGVFDVGAAGTVVALVLVEWLLSVARRQA